LALTAALLLAPAVHAQEAPDPASIVAAAKQASGGAAWDSLDGSWEQGEHGGRAYETWLDFHSYGMRNMIPAGGGTLARGFNGKVSWNWAKLGGTKINDDAERIESLVTAYVATGGYFWPDRFPATLTWRRAATDAGHSYDVIEAVPAGGRAVEFWFDRESHLLGRIVDITGTPAVSVILSDYRQVGPVLIAHAAEIRLPDGTVAGYGKVDKVELRKIERSQFDPPK
jgi:hypothetical protein